MPYGIKIKGELAGVEYAVGQQITLAEGESILTAEGIAQRFPAFAAQVAAPAVAKATEDAKEHLLEMQEVCGDPKAAVDAFVAGQTVAQATSDTNARLAAENAKLKQDLQKAKEATPFAASDGQADPDRDGQPDGGEPKGEDLYKSEWAKDPKLAEEFGALSTYCAYRKGQDAGVIKRFTPAPRG
jgi:hypothetical protein